MTTYCFSLVIAAAFFSEHIPLERLDIEFGAIVFACYFFMHLSSLYERKARRRGRSY